jgi:hypothetical protein
VTNLPNRRLFGALPSRSAIPDVQGSSAPRGQLQHHSKNYWVVTMSIELMFYFVKGGTNPLLAPVPRPSPSIAYFFGSLTISHVHAVHGHGIQW